MRARIPALALAVATWLPAPVDAQRSNSATDISREEIGAVLDVMMGNGIDRQLKVADIGDQNLAVGILHRTGANDTDGNHRGAVHTELHEVYYILAGGGTLLTGGVLSNATEPGPDDLVGPTFMADSRNGMVREVATGDIVIIPAGTLHAWLNITNFVTYLSVRPDPERVLPAGYVNPEIR